MDVKKLLKEIIPKLNISAHKGQYGRNCVIGGSYEYTGAPYFAAISCLRGGCDLITVICHKEAGTAIKSYSPELMVNPLITNDCIISEKSKLFVQNMFNRFSSIICGPGLGRDNNMLYHCKYFINESLNKNISLVLDGDALYMLSLKENKNLLLNNKNNKCIILTPNAMEFRRLWNNYIISENNNNNNNKLPPFDNDDLYKLLNNNKISNSEESKNENQNIKLPLEGVIYSVSDFKHINHINDTSLLCLKLGGITILRKGSVDIICDGTYFILLCNPIIPRRCGGQGDILAGLSGLWLGWCKDYYKNKTNNKNNPSMIAAFAGSYIMRNCALKAYNINKRSTITSDMISQIGNVMEQLFPVESKL